MWLFSSAHHGWCGVLHDSQCIGGPQRLTEIMWTKRKWSIDQIRFTWGWSLVCTPRSHFGRFSDKWVLGQMQEFFKMRTQRKNSSFGLGQEQSLVSSHQIITSRIKSSLQTRQGVMWTVTFPLSNKWGREEKILQYLFLILLSPTHYFFSLLLLYCVSS
jgi:hypothetical protein